MSPVVSTSPLCWEAYALGAFLMTGCVDNHDPEEPELGLCHKTPVQNEDVTRPLP